MRSSEVSCAPDGIDNELMVAQEPGVARRASRAPSLIGSQFELPGIGQDFVSGSQRSALFPWDNAGASSSVGGGPLGSARGSIGRADTRLRGSSLSSRHASPLLGGRILESPADFGARGSLSGDGFEFDGERIAGGHRASIVDILWCSTWGRACGERIPDVGYECADTRAQLLQFPRVSSACSPRT